MAPELRVRLATVRAGTWLTILAATGVLPYLLLSWEQPHRPLNVGLMAGALVASLPMPFLPLHRVLHRPALREGFFIAWTLSMVAFITAAVVLDGGADSPLTIALFLPLAFAATSYPTSSVVAIGFTVAGSFVTVALVQGGVAPGEAILKAVTIAGVAGICAWTARLQAARRAELARMSRTDPLTGALNRRGFEERLTGQLAQAARSAQDCALVLIDLDGFKAVNDRRGHAAGDEVLRRTAVVLQDAVRPGDAVGRLGGDEFAVLLADAGPDGAAEVVARLRTGMADVCAASYGIATAPADGTTAEELHHHADVGLYAAKRSVTRPARTAHDPSRDGYGRDVRPHPSLDAADGAGGELAVALGRRLGLDEQRLAPLRLAALLADVGKTAIPKAVLEKPGPLTPDELALVRTHAPLGERMVRRVGGLEEVAAFVRHSHEHVDGTGYPDGLAGEDIPLESRILLVTDAFEAMTRPRPHRPARKPSDALEELRRCAGTQFDATLVEVLAEELARASAVSV